jgi:putative addiction module component (TIGR02574 family)
MTRDELRQGFLELPAAERRDLVEVLSRSLEHDSEPLPEWQGKLLDDRLEELDANPEEGDPWDVVEWREWAGED